MEKIHLPQGEFSYDPAKPLGTAGGFGQVFAGTSDSGRSIAIKRLHLSAADAAHRELEISEKLVGKTFQHVVPIFGCGEFNGAYYVVMAQAEASLAEFLQRSGAQSPANAAVILLEIVNGLEEVSDLIHRDLKPGNVLRHDDRWKIADFGIARLVEESTSLNTLRECLSPPFAAPEQWRFERATHATDVYALGCVAFCLCKGSPPFSNNYSEAHQHGAPPSLSSSDPRLDAIVSLMLSKVTTARPSLPRIRSVL